MKVEGSGERSMALMFVFGVLAVLFTALLGTTLVLLSRANEGYGQLSIERQAALAASAVWEWFSNDPGAELDGETLRADLPDVMARVRGLAILAPQGRIASWGNVPLEAPDVQAVLRNARLLPFGDRIVNLPGDGQVLYIKANMEFQRRPPMGFGPMMRGAPRILVLHFDGSDLQSEAKLRQVLFYGLSGTAAVFLALMVWLFLRLRRLQGSLERQQTLARLGAASRTLAHEIKNPLSIIKLQKSLLQRTLGPEHQEALSLIERESDRINGLVSQVRQMLAQNAGSSGETQDFEAGDGDGGKSTDMADLMATLKSEMPGWDRSLTLVPPAPGKTAPRVALEPELARSLMTNLIQNGFQAYEASRKATEDGLGQHAQSTRIVTVRWDTEERRKRMSIHVQDSAGGIPRRLRERIFDPFFTTKENGSGVGLSLCRRIVRNAGGDLRYRFIPPSGSDFIVELPLEPQ